MMLPIDPLMTEHRLIEKMIRLMAQETARIRDNMAVSPEFAFVNPKFIDAAVDFICGYADRIHHGKEEEIFFLALEQKPLSWEHLEIMQELQQEHGWGRQTTARLAAAKENYANGSPDSLAEVLGLMEALVDFYPRHIALEDQHFFLPVMAYFTQAEQEALLQQMSEFDKDFDHQGYQKMVTDWEACGCKCHL